MNASVQFQKEPVGSGSPENVVAFAADPETRAVIAAALPRALLREGGIQTAIGAVSQQASPDLLIVDVGETEAPEAALRTLRTLCERTTRIIAVGTVNDVQLFRSLVEAGASDYLLKPVTPEDVTRAVEHAMAQRAEPGAAETGCRTVLVTGARGGAGASSLVAGIAWHLAEKAGLKVAVVDLDLLFGTVALAFDLEPSHGLREILENPQRVDSLFIESAVVRLTERLSILAAEEMLANPPKIQPGAMDRLLAELGRDADCILLDLPCTLLTSHPELMTQADHLAIVSELKLAAIRDVMRLASFAQDNGGTTPVSVIANKVSTRDKPEVTQKEFARGIGMPVSCVLPWDAKSLTEAAKAGRAVTDTMPKAPLSRAMAAVAIALSGHGGRPGADRSIWSRLTGKR